jgi:hypothetical protein
MRTRALLLFLLAGALGCGSGSEPFSTLGDDPNTFVALSFPFTSFTPGGVFPFGQPPTQDAIGFTVGGSTIEARAAAPGLVAETSTTSVTVLHTPAYATRIFGLATVTARLGDYVTTNQSLGIGAPSTLVQFQVLVNGTPVCPASFLSSAARQTLFVVYGSLTYCQQ